LKVKIGVASLAYGLGMTADEFSRAQDSIKRKYMEHATAEKPDEIKYNGAMATLERVYAVQVPRATEPIVVARLFTICARDQLDKLTPDMEKMLLLVGAKVPVIDGEGRLSCFGVLFQRNHRVCLACGLRQACQVEAANYGLGIISLSPKLLGSKNARFATLTDSIQPMTAKSTDGKVAHTTEQTTKSEATTREPFTNTERDEVLLQHLREHYKALKFGDDVYYTHKDGKNACIFYIGKKGEKFDLRFCKPSDELKKSLVRRVRSFYLQDAMSAEDALKLIDQHGNVTFKS
jgi:hypothetical protein